MLKKINGVWIPETVFQGHQFANQINLKHDPQGVAQISIHSISTGDILAIRGLPALSHRLVMADVNLVPGSHFLLKQEITNRTKSSVTVDEHVILDIFGSFWYWPSWNKTGDFQTVTLEPSTDIINNVVLSFVWPSGAGDMENLRFWGAMTNNWDHSLIMYHIIDWNAYQN